MSAMATSFVVSEWYVEISAVRVFIRKERKRTEGKDDCLLENYGTILFP